MSPLLGALPCACLVACRLAGRPHRTPRGLQERIYSGSARVPALEGFIGRRQIHHFQPSLGRQRCALHGKRLEIATADC